MTNQNWGEIVVMVNSAVTNPKIVPLNTFPLVEIECFLFIRALEQEFHIELNITKCQLLQRIQKTNN